MVCLLGEVLVDGDLGAGQCKGLVLGGVLGLGGAEEFGGGSPLAGAHEVGGGGDDGGGGEVGHGGAPHDELDAGAAEYFDVEIFDN